MNLEEVFTGYGQTNSVEYFQGTGLPIRIYEKYHHLIRKLAIDNPFSEGVQIGLSTHLNFIIKDVEESYGYRFSSRSKLAKRIKNSDYMIQMIGEGQVRFRPIVDSYFKRVASRMIELIRKRWKKAPDVEFFYVLGGETKTESI